ncbi:MAG: SagB/ThcOx family dehydrogenase [Cyanobacteriota bacterium]|nr:SagB/ThcOx family dehydrogenase [Cyanobacteriota bacterium]
MLKAESPGKYYHQETKHSYLSVALDPNYVDGSTQPSCYKSYPQFYCRFPLNFEESTERLIRLSSQITFEKTYGNSSYKLRVNPSAGALYPTELYVQIRGIQGFVDGIYHVEVAENSLTLIYQLIDDGVEDYIIPNYWIKGLIFIVSCVYFRSSWKYKDRSLRYCFLDSGHHLGAIEAAAYLEEQDTQLYFDFDKLALNQDLGFENKEFVTAAVVIGEGQEKQTRRLRSQIPFVSGTDYFEVNSRVETGYQETILPQSFHQTWKQPKFYYEPKKFLEVVFKRRSARRFQQKFLTQDDWIRILNVLEQPIPSVSFEAIEIYAVVHRVCNLTPGIYRGNQLIKAGDFSEKTGYLCINQAIGRDSAVTLFFVCDYQNYQTALQGAGLIGQRLYLVSHYLNLGCSGIGAYYDDETRTFLDTEKDVLYALAIGH